MIINTYDILCMKVVKQIYKKFLWIKQLKKRKCFSIFLCINLLDYLLHKNKTMETKQQITKYEDEWFLFSATKYF